MKKTIFIYILLIFAANLFDISFLPRLRYGSLESLAAQLIIVILGFVIFKKQEYSHDPIILNKYYKRVLLVLLSVGITIFTSMAYWNQTVLQSITTLRPFSIYLFFILLMRIKPTAEQVEDALKYFSYTFGVIFILMWVFGIHLTNRVYDSSQSIESNNAIQGTTILLLYFYICLSSLYKEFSRKLFILASFILIVYVLNQNRSILFPVLAFFIISILKTNLSGIKKMSFVIVVVSVGAFLLYNNIELLNGVIEETKGQMNDDNYVRWKAIDYFLTGMSPNFICAFLGNGIISVHSNPLLWRMLHSNMLNFNDVGWFGYYAFFGVTGIMAIGNIIFRVIFDKEGELSIRMLFLHMLVPTIWCFWSSEIIIIFCLAIYIYCYKKDLQNNNNLNYDEI